MTVATSNGTQQLSGSISGSVDASGNIKGSCTISGIPNIGSVSLQYLKVIKAK